MTQVAVIHTAFEDTPRTVAFVDVPEFPTVIETLEYCYRWTNNIAGSWSKGEILTGDNGETVNNGDYNKNVTVMADLPVYDGKTYGMRSTSVDDQMVIGNQKYVVAGCGFKTIDGKEV
tara:strand:- start:283 stop:636 length:354 start_codon:yes stop_codon:yes gene_type:complete